MVEYMEFLQIKDPDKMTLGDLVVFVDEARKRFAPFDTEIYLKHGMFNISWNKKIFNG